MDHEPLVRTTRPGPTLFPKIRLHGRIEPLIVPNVPSCAEAVEGLPAAVFEGTYRPQERALQSQQGEFVVQVSYEGEPGTSQGEITGGRLRHRAHRRRLQRLSPGRLNRGRQRAGGVIGQAR